MRLYIPYLRFEETLSIAICIRLCLVSNTLLLFTYWALLSSRSSTALRRLLGVAIEKKNTWKSQLIQVMCCFFVGGNQGWQRGCDHAQGQQKQNKNNETSCCG